MTFSLYVPAGTTVAERIAACGLHRDKRVVDHMRFNGVQSFGADAPPQALFTCPCGTTISIEIAQAMHDDCEVQP